MAACFRLLISPSHPAVAYDCDSIWVWIPDTKRANQGHLGATLGSKRQFRRLPTNNYDVLSLQTCRETERQTFGNGFRNSSKSCRSMFEVASVRVATSTTMAKRLAKKHTQHN